MNPLADGRQWIVITGDNREILPTLDQVDHVITDPPYEAEAHTKSRRSGKGGDAKKNGVVNLPIDFEAIDEKTRAFVGNQFQRICKRWLLVFCQDQGLDPWFSAVSPMKRIRAMVWVKPDSSPQFSGDRPACGYEFIALAHPAGKTRWNGGGRRGVFVHGSKDPAHRPEGHATPKPEPLMLELVDLFTDPGDLVLDPFCGSGTTGVACLRLGRRFVGIEKNPEWAELSRDRLRAEEVGSTLRALRSGQEALFR